MFNHLSFLTRTCLRGLVIAAALAIICSSHADVVWQQSPDIEADWGPSQLTQGGGESVNAEVADDFELNGLVSQINAKGYESGQTSSPPLFGVYVRFYEFGADNKPGALQQEYFLPVGDPRLVVFTPSYPSNFNITLDPPFVATGKHFVSVQVVMNVVFGSHWYWRSANTGNPSGEALYMRNPGIGVNDWSHDMYIDIWGQPYLLGTADCDAAFTLLGTALPPGPAIESLGQPSVAQGDRLVIHGEQFGAIPGTVLIGGVPAAISAWSNLQITVYPVDATPLGEVPVQVIATGGTSNAANITVVPREDPDGPGRVQWRFRADGLYIDSRAVVGPDGTIYAGDIHARIYALEPDGGVKWIFRANPPTLDSAIEITDEGVILIGALHVVIAINPDGTERWRFSDPVEPIFVGPTVGPDGNIYVLDRDNANGGLGAYSLTPDGELRWNVPGFFWPDPPGFPGMEMVFDNANHVIFVNDGIGPGGDDNFFALDRDSGAIAFSRDGATQQPAVSPAGDRIYAALYDPFTPASLVALAPDGSEIFSIFGHGSEPGINAGIDVGADGNLYTATTLNHVVSVDSDGEVRWTFDPPGQPFRYDPIVSPANDVVVVAAYTPMQLGSVFGVDATDGSLQWTVELPFENDGFVWPMYRARPRFSNDGVTVYLGTTHNNYLPDPYSYLYAIDASISKTSQLTGDATGDGAVDIEDLLAVISGWGPCSETCPADLTFDGHINVDDLLMVIANWST